MDFPFWLAKRISRSSTKGYSGSLIKLAIATIALSIAVMILASAIIRGFKGGVSEKIYGFWGNIHVTDIHSTRNFELKPILNDEELKASIKEIASLEYNSTPKGDEVNMKVTKGGVRAISPFLTYPGILSGKQEIEGIILKGINDEYDKTSFHKYLKEGTFPIFNDSKASREIMISVQTSKRLGLGIGDYININFLKDKNSIKRRCKVSGLGGCSHFSTVYLRRITTSEHVC